MKPFEELYTAWIDGRLTGDELDEFERSLPDRATAEADRADAARCREFLRRHADAPSLSNADFFSHQLLERIAVEDRAPQPAERPARTRWFFSIPGLSWAGAFCAMGATVAYFGMTRVDRFRSVAVTPTAAIQAEPEVYDATIVEATPHEPGVSATSIQEDNMTVLWLDGLDYLPASYKLQ